jgi:hypothetical protein
MADGSFPGLVSRNRDANALANEIYVGISDGTEQLLINAAGEAGVETNFEYAVDSVAGAADVGAAVLTVRDDALTTLTPADGDYVRLRVDSTGALWTHPTVTGDMSNVVADDSAFTVGTDTVGAVGMLADETAPDSVDEGDIGIPRMTLDRKQLFVGVDATTDSQRWTIDAGGALQVDVTDQVPGTGATNLGKAVDSAGGATDTGVAALALRDDILTTLTPADGDYVRLRTDSIGALWVRPIEEGVSGTEVHDYDTAAAVASDATSNHDYTVTGTNFLLKSVIWSGSGSVKAEIQTGPLASLATVAVGFLTGRQGDTQQLFFDPPVEVPVTSTGTVRVIRTNRQGAATDVYSTIIGNDV